MSMNIGDTVTPPPATDHLDWGSGKVVYIHPKKRFYTVEFTYGNRKFRESYSFVTPMSEDTHYRESDRGKSIRTVGKFGSLRA